MSSFENDDPRMNEFKSEPMPPPMPKRAIPNPPAGVEPGRSAQPAQPAQPDRLVPVPILSFLTKARMFLGAMVGPRVDAEMWRQRMGACLQCPELDVIRGRFWDKLYCGACNCWRWWFALLKRKNRYTLHVCPRGRHPGQTQERKECAGCGG